eukprot:IDg22478t1
MKILVQLQREAEDVAEFRRRRGCLSAAAAVAPAQALRARASRSPSSKILSKKAESSGEEDIDGVVEIVEEGS